MRYVLLAVLVAGIALIFVSPVIGGVVAGGALLAFMFSRSALGGGRTRRGPG